MRTSLVVALAAGLLLAGCAQAGPKDEEAPPELVAADSFDDFELQDTAPTTGVIRGVVVDASLAPLAGAFVELIEQGQNMTTTEAGVFAFKDVPPGIHFIKASRAGYETTQTSVDVVAGLDEPEAVRVLLQRIPGTEPRAVGAVFEGFINCSIRIPGAGFNDGCGVFGDLGLGSTQRVEVVYEGKGIQWWQGEMTWTSTGATTETLCFEVRGETLEENPVCGPDPLMLSMDRSKVEANDLEEGEAIELIGYPDHLAGGVSGNLVLQQSFKFVYYAFYNFVPEPGWTFVADGEPVPPP